MMRTWKKLASLSMALVMLLLVLAACGGDPGSNGGGSDTTPAGGSAPTGEQTGEATPGTNSERERVTVVYSRPNTVLDNTSQIENDPIKQAIEAAVNIDLVYDSGFDGYTDRVQTELAAGTGADLFPNYGQQELTSKWVNDGVVVNIGEIVNAQPDRYPILHMMINSPEYQMYNKMYTGDPEATYAIYALTYSISWAGASVYNVQMMNDAGYDAPPTTVEEFIDLATKIAQNGNSGWWPRNNTLTNLNEIDKTLFSPNGTSVMAPEGDPWVGFMPVGGKSGIEGEWKLMTTSEETRDTLKLLAEMYQTGALDLGIGVKDDFAQAKIEFMGNQIGIFNHAFSSWGQVKDWAAEYLEANPDATWESLALGATLTGSAGQGVTYSAPYWMGYNWFIPISCKNPERVLDLVEFLASDAGQDLLFKGIEGQHYTIENGEVVYNIEEWTKQGEIYNTTDGRIKYCLFVDMFAGGQQQLKLEGGTNWYAVSTNPIVVDVTEDSDFKAYVNGVLDSYRDDVAGFMPPYFTIIEFSDEMKDARIAMKEITLQYVPAFITGQKSIDAEWEDYVAAYEAAGAAQLEEEFNAGRVKAKEDFEALVG